MRSESPLPPLRCTLRFGDGARACWLIALFHGVWQGGAVAAQDISDLTLEQWLDLPIVSASKFAQKTSEVPSAVTVITRGDIQQYGWRTLAEALRSVRGFFIHGDRSYEYIGARVGAYGVINLTLLQSSPTDGWELSASVFNVLDRVYANPAAEDVSVPTRDRLVQNGRTFRIKAVHAF